MNPVKKFAITASYITCLPLYRLPKEAPPDLFAGLAKFLPSVGLMLGSFLAIAAFLLEAGHVNNLLGGALITMSWLIATGGIHCDGLMDTADGIFSHRDQARMLEIMSDSRVGNFGALTGFGVILTKFACLASLPFPALLPVLILVPCWARWCETFAIGAFPYLRDKGMGKIWHDTTNFPIDLYIAGAVPAAATSALTFLGFGLSPLVAALTIFAGLIASFWLNSILKGQTGDTYGAVVELSETGALLCTAILINLPLLVGP